jgi:membrane-associated phospholipid phosphatase
MRFRAAFACFALLGVLTVLVAVRWSPLVGFDSAISEAARRYGTAHPGWVGTWAAITHAGDPIVALVLGVATVALLLIARRYGDALVVIGVVVVAEGATTAIHAAIGRERPPNGFVFLDSSSFPSGHTLQSATSALLIAYLLWPRLPLGRRPQVAAVLGLAAVSVALSRVFLRAHWPTDIVGAWLLATATFFLVTAVADRLRRRLPVKAGT